MSVHLEGMGLTGCLLAWRLERAGVAFTWSDTDAPRTAWRACTGAIYPGGGIDRECYEWWQSELAALEDVAQGTTEPAGYWFNHKSPPHGGAYEVIRRVPGVHAGSGEAPEPRTLSLAELPSFHVNAQHLVPALRRRYEQRREQRGPTHGRYVVAHGFGERMRYAYWGWTRLVELSVAPELGVESARSAFYFRRGRFVMAYAYPVPGAPFWYAGSSLIRQHAGRLKSLVMEPKYERWQREFESLSGGLVTVRRAGAFIEGWRPSRDERVDPFKVKVRDGRILVPPLWNSGLRHFPRVWAGVAAALGLADCVRPLSPAASTPQEKETST